jgi:hypothetical protein
MVASSPTKESLLQLYIDLGWARSMDEAQRKNNFHFAFVLAVMPLMFTIVPLTFGLLLQLFDAILGQLSK